MRTPFFLIIFSTFFASSSKILLHSNNAEHLLQHFHSSSGWHLLALHHLPLRCSVLCSHCSCSSVSSVPLHNQAVHQQKLLQARPGLISTGIIWQRLISMEQMCSLEPGDPFALSGYKTAHIQEHALAFCCTLTTEINGSFVDDWMSYTFFQCWLSRKGCSWRKRTQSPRYLQSQTDELNGDFPHVISALLSRWYLFFPCLLARHVSRRCSLCCWVAPALEVLKQGNSVLQAACSWLFIIFSSIWGFYAVSSWMAVICQWRLCTNLHHRHVSACKWGSVGAASPGAVQRMEKDADTLLQQELWPSLCCLLQLVSVRTITAAVGKTDEDKSYKFLSPDLLSIPVHCHEVKETAVSAYKFHLEHLESGLISEAS